MAYQTSFTPSGGSAIEIIIFKHEGDFDPEYQYRLTNNPQLVGSNAIFVMAPSQVVDVEITGLFAIEAALKAVQNQIGVLNVRGASHANVRLMNAKRIKGLQPTTTLVTNQITNTYYYTKMMLKLIKEAT